MLDSYFNKILPLGNKEAHISGPVHQFLKDMMDDKSPLPESDINVSTGDNNKNQSEPDINVSTGDNNQNENIDIVDSDDQIIMPPKESKEWKESEESDASRLKATCRTRSFRAGKQQLDEARAKEPSRKFSYAERCGDFKYSHDQFSFCSDDLFMTKKDRRKKSKKNRNKINSNADDNDSMDLPEFSDGAINQSTHRVNRYKNEWKKYKHSRVRLSSFIQSKILLVNFDDLSKLNKSELGVKENESHLKKIGILFEQLDLKCDTYSVSKMKDIYLPMNIINQCRNMGNKDGNGVHKNVIGIEYADHLWGYLFIRFIFRPNTVRVINRKRVYGVEICARAQLFRPANISMCSNISTINGIKYLQQLHLNYVASIAGKCGFNEQKRHKVGFVWHHSHSFLGGDLAQFYNMLGISGTATNCCIICYTTQQEIRDDPHPENVAIWKSERMRGIKLKVNI